MHAFASAPTEPVDSRTGRKELEARDPSSPQEYEASIAANGESVRRVIGVGSIRRLPARWSVRCGTRDDPPGAWWARTTTVCGYSRCAGRSGRCPRRGPAAGAEGAGDRPLSSPCPTPTDAEAGRGLQAPASRPNRSRPASRGHDGFASSADAHQPSPGLSGTRAISRP